MSSEDVDIVKEYRFDSKSIEIPHICIGQFTSGHKEEYFLGFANNERIITQYYKFATIDAVNEFLDFIIINIQSNGNDKHGKKKK